MGKFLLRRGQDHQELVGEEGVEAKSIGEVWPKQSMWNQGVAAREEIRRLGEPPCPFGVSALCPGSKGLLQHAKDSEWLEKVVQG